MFETGWILSNLICRRLDKTEHSDFVWSIQFYSFSFCLDAKGKRSSLRECPARSAILLKTQSG